MGSKLDSEDWPYAIEHTTEHARSLVLLPSPKGLSFGARVVARKGVSSSERRGFVPGAGVDHLLVHRHTTNKEALVLVEKPDEEPQVIIGAAPVELSSVPWAVDYGQETADGRSEKYGLPGRSSRLQTANLSGCISRPRR